MSNKTIPAISVIIPMYNAEKYVAECLDSLLAQTFKDFEVIVVDDGSTDNSAAIVEKYLKRGGGRIQLVRSKVNSGGCPGIPRNTGLRLAVGEYIFFLDSDDAIINTALGELYRLAKKFDADVVHSNKYYTMDEEKSVTDTKNLTETSFLSMPVGNKPEMLPSNIVERIEKFGRQKISWTTCSSFTKRKLIAENNISFPLMYVAEDMFFTVSLLCHAKNFLEVPNAFYAWRLVKNSLSRSNLTVDKRINRYAKSIFKGIESFEKLFNSIEELKNNDECRYYVFDVLASTNIQENHQLLPIYAQFPVFQVDSLIRQELEDIGDTKALTAFLFNRMNFFNLSLNQQRNLIIQQNQLLQKSQIEIQRLQAQLQQTQNPSK